MKLSNVTLSYSTEVCREKGFKRPLFITAAGRVFFDFATEILNYV